MTVAVCAGWKSPVGRRGDARPESRTGFGAEGSLQARMIFAFLVEKHLGMYVMDEGWDMWYAHKNPFDYAASWRENHVSDLEAMVRRDFNHPSVLMYSIGNEVTEPGRDEGVAAAKALVSILHHLDSTRPVTAGINLVILAGSARGDSYHPEEGLMDSTKFNEIAAGVGSGMNHGADDAESDRITSPVLDALDIAGYNYASGRYPLEKEVHPDRVIVGSETFPQDLPKNWAMVKELPYLIGDFMWTAWDYIGEAGIGAWAYSPDGIGFNKPYSWLLADTGAFDILGNPTGELFWAGAVWGRLNGPAICVQPVNHDTPPAKAAWRGTNAIPGRALAVVRAGDAGELILRTEDTHIAIPICEA